MAQYKVPQDVEADDKLLGPFSFRQFVYLLIAGGLAAMAVGLFQIFPLLAIIPLPPILLFGAMALPLKKDQPMETYLAAVASYYLKPRGRVWMPGQREATIDITAPKQVDDDRTRGITSEEATHRLSFLADIVDTEGYAIKGIGANHVNEELVVEAIQAPDMFETDGFGKLENAIAKDENERHAEVVEGMREEIAKAENLAVSGGVVKRGEEGKVAEESPVEKAVEQVVEKETAEEPKESMGNPEPPTVVGPNFDSSVVVGADLVLEEKPVEKPDEAKTNSVNPSIMELANNADYSIATIAKEANRIKEREEEGEVFISLH